MLFRRILLGSLFLLFCSFNSFCAESVPPTLKSVGVSENLGAYVPLNVSFYDADGTGVSLNTFFHNDKAVILNLAYYTCPMLCHFVANGLVEGLKQLPFPVGQKYDVITISINPNDTSAAQNGFRNRYLKSLNQKSASENWAFLRGDQSSIKSITDAVGFKYRYDEMSKEFAHSGVIVVLTEDGKISRYLYGIEFSPFDLKMGVLEALDKKVISSVDHLLLFCYNYDPQSRKYVIYAWNIMRVVAAISVLFLGIVIFKLKKSENNGK